MSASPSARSAAASSGSSDDARSTGGFGPARELACRECGATAPLGDSYVCMECFGPLEIGYDFGTVTHADIETGPQSMWRYAPLLPVPADVASRKNLAPGMTKLVKADNLAKALGMKTVWVKDDSGNPTHSFKDRVVAIALSAAQELGFTMVGCASTGNLAGAVAAAAARAGLNSCVIAPSDLEAGKLVTAAIYGGTLVAVDGNYDDVNRLCSEIAADMGWGFCNVNLRPYYAEGSKTVGYEIAEQLGWRLPRQLVSPIASGSLMTKVDKAFGELVKLGLVDETPAAIFGAQATGCSPVSKAWAVGHDVVQPVRPDTIAKSLAIGNPADGPYAIDVARRTGGAIADVSDDEIVAGIQLLAETEGIFAETAGGVTVSVLKKLLDAGQLDPDAETVVLNTGDGLKTLDAVAPVASPTVTISPKYADFRAFAEASGLSST